MAEPGSPIQPRLTPVGEKSLPAKCKTDMITYCPSMDLIAVVTDDEELRVFRLNGQKVFGGSYKGDPYLDDDDGSGEIRAVRWKNDGTFLIAQDSEFLAKLTLFWVVKAISWPSRARIPPSASSARIAGKRPITTRHTVENRAPKSPA